MKAISLFSGAGGLDLGCEAAGFGAVCVVEHDSTAKATMRANQPRYFSRLRSEAMFGDITELCVATLVERAQL